MSVFEIIIDFMFLHLTLFIEKKVNDFFFSWIVDALHQNVIAGYFWLLELAPFSVQFLLLGVTH